MYITGTLVPSRDNSTLRQVCDYGQDSEIFVASGNKLKQLEFIDILFVLELLYHTKHAHLKAQMSTRSDKLTRK